MVKRRPGVVSEPQARLMVVSQSNTAALWETWRRLYPLYCGLAREFVIQSQPCQDLELALEVPGPEAFADAETWFAEMDARVHIHHLRHFGQTSAQMTEKAIADLLFHFLQKKRKTDQDRDKVDFLIVQLIAMRLPPRAASPEITLESVSTMLGSVVGINGRPPSFANDLEQMLAEVEAAKNLNALFTSRTIERAREIKQSCGAEFFTPGALVAFARFGLLIRRRFFQLMQQDLNTVLDGLRQLENQGVATIDCRKAQFSAEEPISRIRMICQSWRVMFQAEYSSGQPLCLLVDLKTAVQSALAENQNSQPRAASGKAAAAAARE